MKFFSETVLDKAAIYFSVLISDYEIRRRESDATTLDRFIRYTLISLGNMIAAYYFKHHKDELVKFIESDECKQMIVNKLVERFEVKIK